MFRLLAVKLTLITLVTVFYLPVTLLARCMKKSRRGHFWRVCAIYVIRASFFSGGIRVVAANNMFADEPLIYASNHPSEMDGFLLQMFLGPDTVPIIAPHRQFPYMISLWLRGMEAIDVVRDDIDNAKYKGSNTKRQAFHKMLATLKRGNSLLIFPEGHTELIQALYAFHTGAARISFASQVPIQTVILKDAHRVFSDTFKSQGRTVTVEYGKVFTPDEGYDEGVIFTQHGPTRQRIREVTAALENEVLRHLPVSDKQEQRKESSDIGVFVDIDSTIYRSLSQMDFLMNLTKMGYVPKIDFLRIAFLFLLEKLRVIHHETLMREAVQLLAGWNVTTLDRLIGNFFRTLALPKLEYGLFAIIEDHLAKNHHVVFVTEVMHPIAKEFTEFFEADKAIDTSLAKRGLRYTGEITLLCRDKQKATSMQEFIDRHNINVKKSYAYANSYTDIPFLSLVGHPMAVNPDGKLRKYAEKHGMPILKKHS